MAGVNAIADLLAWFGWYVIPFIVILSLIVAVHELGHYFVGRWCGVKIDAFSLGFGHELFAPSGFARHPLADWRACRSADMSSFTATPTPPASATAPAAIQRSIAH